MENVSWGIIIQARAGSTRLPLKMLKPFAAHPSLLQLILEKLVASFGSSRVLLATTDNPADNEMEEIALRWGVSVFRGNESDVLDRFIQAAATKSWSHVMRVCADNPFLNSSFLQQLAATGVKNKQADYISWFFADGQPSIRSHSGFFGEWVSVAALKKVAEATTDKFYREHVTNFIYTHPDQFEIVKIPIPPARESFYSSVRLTIDTASDFETAEKVFMALSGTSKEIETENIFKYLEHHPELKNKMRLNIENNAK